MLSLGHTIYLWRLKRKFTQFELSIRTKISRPNLSVIEEGNRDLTVSTLKRIAQALNVNPGILIDGVAPEHQRKRTFSRESLDQIARWVVTQKGKLSPEEIRIGELTRSLLKRKLSLDSAISNRLPRTARKEERALLALKALLDSTHIENLLSRIDKLLGLSS